MNVYTEVSDAKMLQALNRLAKQLDPWPLPLSPYFAAIREPTRPHAMIASGL